MAPAVFPDGRMLAFIRGTSAFLEINSGTVRVVLGALNLTTGAETFFDNDRDVLTPDHIMAGTPLPAGFSPVSVPLRRSNPGTSLAF